MSFYSESKLFIDRHEASQLALVSVVQTVGSTPRHCGTHMLVSDQGSIFGTVGGGRVEYELIKKARTVVNRGVGVVVTHHLVRDLAMCCGGSMTVVITPFACSVHAWNQLAMNLDERVCTQIRLAVDAPLELDPGDALSKELSNGCHWDGTVFTQLIEPATRAILFGAGHISTALVPLLVAANFEVVLCDDNDSGAFDLEPGVFREVRKVWSFELSDVRRELGSLGQGDYAIVVTRDHAIDQRVIEALLAGPPLSYLGLIGSRGKVGRFRRRILAKGVVDESCWQRLDAPMGIDIGAETPIEIAISIAAQLIHRRAHANTPQASVSAL